MSKTLQERLHDAKSVLDHVYAALGRHSTALPKEVEDSFRALVDYHEDIDHWLRMLEARAAARQLFDALETKADAVDCVLLGTAHVKYQHVRFIGVQAYVTTNWALADRITGMVGRVLCTPAAGLNDVKPAELSLISSTEIGSGRRLLRPSSSPCDRPSDGRSESPTRLETTSCTTGRRSAALTSSKGHLSHRPSESPLMVGTGWKRKQKMNIG